MKFDVVKQVVFQLMKTSKAAIVETQEDSTHRTIVRNLFSVNVSPAVMHLMKRPKLVEIVGVVPSDHTYLLWHQLRRGLELVPRAKGSSLRQGTVVDRGPIQPIGKGDQFVGKQLLDHFIGLRSGGVEIFPDDEAVRCEPIEHL